MLTAILLVLNLLGHPAATAEPGLDGASGASDSASLSRLQLQTLGSPEPDPRPVCTVRILRANPRIDAPFVRPMGVAVDSGMVRESGCRGESPRR